MTTTTANPNVIRALQEQHHPTGPQALLHAVFAADEIPEGVVKAKHLAKGQKVRAFVKGEARGKERIVVSTERINEGAQVIVTWEGADDPTTHAASYRWLVLSEPAKAKPRRHRKGVARVRTEDGMFPLDNRTVSALEAAKASL